jgi:hypothetical protein
MSIIDKQLAINSIKLPMDVINMIKDFIFYDQRNKTKNKKNKLIARIKSLHYTALDYGEYQLNYTGLIFDGEYLNVNGIIIEDNPHIYCDFCLKCGNYQNNALTPINNKIICHCLRISQKPHYWSTEWPIYWKS